LELFHEPILQLKLYIKLFAFSRQPKDGTEVNTISNGSKNLTTSNGLDKSFNQDANVDNSKSIRIVVPNHVIPLDVPQEKHPNSSFANNFIRYQILV
jgi:hypothetical protein